MNIQTVHPTESSLKLEKSLEIVGTFLSRFYHEQPDDDVAATMVLRATTGQYEYIWKIAQAFEKVLKVDLPAQQLVELVRVHANRREVKEGQARRFLEQVFIDTALDVALEPNA